MANAYPAYHVTGPVHHWIRYSGTISFLGTCQTQPQIKIQQFRTGVMSDLSGPMLPAQKIDNGEVGSLGIALNRFSKATLATVRASQGPLGTTTAPGRRSRFSRGQLMYGNGGTFELWQVFDNALDANVRAMSPGLERGWYWPQVEFLAEDFVQLGNGKEQIQLLTLEAQPSFTAITGNSGGTPYVASGDREFYLYGTADALFPADVLLPQ